MRQFRTYSVCGVDVAALSPEEAAQLLASATASRDALEVHLCNAFTLSLVDTNPELRAALRRDALNLPDGSPVAWLGRRRGARGPVRGPSLMLRTAELTASDGSGHYLYGGAPGVAETLADELRRRVGTLNIVGCETPPYRPLTDDEVKALAERLIAAEAGIVWVGLGTPRQDYLVPRLSEHYPGVIVPVGAAFDFLSGRVPEAPPWLHGTGLEWLYRFASEPRRLWRRYLIGNPRFAVSAMRHRRLETSGRAAGSP